MEPQYSGWMKSSHRDVAGCNDCHTPHDVVGKYMTKASNGFWHSFYFTTGNYPDNIQARPISRTVTENACRHCHSDITEAIAGPHFTSAPAESVSCIKCHREVGHPR